MGPPLFLKTLAALAASAFLGLAHAEMTPIKFQLDWRFEGPSALFLTPEGKGYFKDAQLDVRIDAGNGSGGTVARVASGTYDMGFADLTTLMAFHANNPDLPNKPVAIMMVYNNSPASVMVLKKSGIKSIAHLSGKKFAAPVFDASRRIFPIFAKANKITGVQWTSVDPTQRETLLARGEVDAITGFTFTSLYNLKARGIEASEVTVFPYADYGVKFYGNVIFASPKLLKEHPAAVKAFLLAFTHGVRDVLAKPESAIAFVRQRDANIDVALETQRLKMTLDTVVNSPNARVEGFGNIKEPRLNLMASQVSDAFNTENRVDAKAVWNGSFLPSAKALNVLPDRM